MSKPILTLVMFCPQKGQHSGRPGESINNVQLNAITPSVLGAKAEDPNPGVFVNSNGNASLSLNQVTDATAGVFSGGKKYRVTVETIED